MIFLQEAMVGGLFLLIGFVFAIIIAAIAIYILVKTLQKKPRDYTQIESNHLLDEEIRKQILKDYNTNRFISFSIVFILLLVVVAIFYKACTITFD